MFYFKEKESQQRANQNVAARPRENVPPGARARRRPVRRNRMQMANEDSGNFLFSLDLQLNQKKHIDKTLLMNPPINALLRESPSILFFNPFPHNDTF